jgi:hypothetical protein
MSKIFIAGDSYGRGEWAISGDLTHDGIEHYFKEIGCQVINCAGCGFSLRESFCALTDCLAEHYQTGDIILWIQTDPSRDINYDTVHEDLKMHGGLNVLLKYLITKTYHDMDQLAKHYNTVIYAIGGLFDLYTDCQYTNLNFLVKSWIKLLLGDDCPEHFGIVKSITVNRLNFKNFGPKLSQQIVDEIWDWDQNSTLLYHSLFPDKFHPNRHGHKILFDYIIPKLNLDN